MRFCLLALMAGAAAAGNLPAAIAGEVERLNAEPLECEVRASADKGLLRLDAIAIANGEAAGRYRFAVARSGRGGNSQALQSGKFSIGAGETRIVSTTTISLGEDERYEARLFLSWDGVERSCASGGG